jgi:hypothetical protein
MTPEALNNLILNAKLGSARKDAQIDSCGPFAAALHDILKMNGMRSSIWSAEMHWEYFSKPEWGHYVVRYIGIAYDSLGFFDKKIICKREKIKSNFCLVMRRMSRQGIFEDDEINMYNFFYSALAKQMKSYLGKHK